MTRRGQAGFTLMELLLVITVSGLIAIPLLAWVALGLRSEKTASQRSAESKATNLVASYLPRDVAVSTSVVTGGADCTGGRAGGVVVLSVVRDRPGQPRSLVAYSMVARPDGSADLVRRTCDSPGTPVTDEVPLAPKLAAPAGGWAAMAQCSDRAAIAADTCGQVRLSLTFASKRTVTVGAVRRIAGPL